MIVNVSSSHSSHYFSRLARSTLLLLPLFSVHYFFFMWNTKPLLIWHLILVHLTVHTISSSLQVNFHSIEIQCVMSLVCRRQGFMVALIYTLVNCEVQRELFRSTDRWLLQHRSSWRQPKFFRNYMNKLDNERLYSCGYRTRTSLPIQSYSARSSGVFPPSRYASHYRSSLDHQNCQALMNPRNSATPDLSLTDLSKRPNTAAQNRSSWHQTSKLSFDVVFTCNRSMISIKYRESFRFSFFAPRSRI